MIPCWDIAIATMRTGERAVITCGSTYAYGSTGWKPLIKPSARLLFDVRLMFTGTAS